MSEKTDVQDKVFQKLYDANCLVMRINGGTRGNVPFYYWKALFEPTQDDLEYYDKMLRKGASDIMGMFPDGTPFYYETKAGTKPTTEQLLFLREVVKRGAVGRIIDDPAQVDRDIQEHCF